MKRGYAALMAKGDVLQKSQFISYGRPPGLAYVLHIYFPFLFMSIMPNSD